MIRVLVADDHALVRRGLRELIEEESDLDLVAEAATAADLMTLARGKPWDVAVVDLNLPDASGLDVLKNLKAQYPGRAVLILSMHPEDQYAVRALRAGAAGYLNKEGAPGDLLAAIRKAARGGRYVSDTLAERLATELGGREGLPHERLSDREFQVLRLIASGRTATEIAGSMHLSVKTVSTYRTRILDKMGLKHNAELTRYALEHHLVE
jgi:DNA-binding NarL/FixJ family response regulator